ncbi:hypothetical protein QUA87_10685, partial [Microcoleus sp. F6_C2]
FTVGWGRVYLDCELQSEMVGGTRPYKISLITHQIISYFYLHIFPYGAGSPTIIAKNRQSQKPAPTQLIACINLYL